MAAIADSTCSQIGNRHGNKALLGQIPPFDCAIFCADTLNNGGPLEAHGLDRQPCMVHMRRTFARRLRKLPEEVRKGYAPRLKRLRELLRELPAEGAAILMGWLEEAVAPEVPAPKAWRNLVQHFLERWNQMRIHGRAPDVPATTNRLEGRFGRLKPRVRRARGFPTRAGAHNFLHAVTRVCA